jgi:hypothetical protein
MVWYDNRQCGKWVLRILQAAKRQAGVAKSQREPFMNEWSGYPDPRDPDNYWIDDKTGERVNAWTGERTND